MENDAEHPLTLVDGHQSCQCHGACYSGLTRPHASHEAEAEAGVTELNFKAPCQG